MDALVNNGHEVEILPTDTGDFTIFGLEETWVAERKTQADLRGSLSEQRGWEQIKALADAREQGFFPFIIFESGYMWDNSAGRKVSWDTFLKRHPNQEKNYYAMITGVAKWKVPLIPTKDEDGTAILLGYIDDMLGKTKEKKDFPLREGMKKGWSLEQKRLHFWQAFGCEVGKAINKESKCPTSFITRFQHFDDWLPDDDIINTIADIKLDSGRRVGIKKATEIWEVLFS